MAMARPPMRANELAATVPAGLLGTVAGGVPEAEAEGVVVRVTTVSVGAPVPEVTGAEADLVALV